MLDPVWTESVNVNNAPVSTLIPSFGPVYFGFYVALRPRRRDDLLGTGTEWERGQGDWLDRGNRPKKTGETVDRR